uniref:Tudor domain-containing protein 7 n=1 Tax=Latimeria chalumnae TaxID=7897 RepID=H3B4S9_LATCH
MSETEKELVSKMLRAVLQSSKNGVALSRLQGEYRGLTGEFIPFKQLGYPTLEAFLKSIPSVVKMEGGRVGGEVVCFAAVCSETAHIAKLVARQRSSKKKVGGPVNCQMRLKHTAPVMQVGKPKMTLRQPGYPSQPGRGGRRQNPPLTRGKGSFHGTGKPSSENYLNIEVTMTQGGGAARDVSIQRHLSMPSTRSERRLTLPPRFQKELQVHLSKNTGGDPNANWNENLSLGKPPAPDTAGNLNVELVQCRLTEILTKFSNGIWASKLPQFYKDMYKQELNAEVLKHLEEWTHICKIEKLPNSGQSDVLLYPAKYRSPQTKCESDLLRPPKSLVIDKPTSPVFKPVTPPSLSTVDSDLKQKVAVLLVKYSSGLWANALPKVFEDTYKAKFPENMLSNLESLSDICSVDYPIANNPKKAILYAKAVKQADANQNATGQASVQEDLQQIREQEFDQKHAEPLEKDLNPPPLTIPDEESPSVLVVELANTNEVVIRYVGNDYSRAQELMEDKMKDYYKSSVATPTQTVSVDKLVAVKAEEDAWLRAQVIAVEGERVKVCYIDYGFNEIVEKNKLRNLERQFYSLSFQATKCKLAGLESFSDDPALLKCVELLACGKILAVEILERSDIPLVVLYDTSGEDDVNINATCLKALHDKTLDLGLKAGSSYTNVKITNVCSDGTVYCQIPSKGLRKLNDGLDKIDQFFGTRQITSEFFVSIPFCGKYCLFNYKGKWTRIEIYNPYSEKELSLIFLYPFVLSFVFLLAFFPEVFPVFCTLVVVFTVGPQALKCCLADLPFNIGMWTPDAVLWLRDTVLNCSECSVKVVKVEAAKGLVHIYLFTSKNFPNPDRSINRQIANADLWKHQKDVFLSVSNRAVGTCKARGDTCAGSASDSMRPKKPLGIAAPKTVADRSSVLHTTELPPLLPLPKPSEHMDVYINVAHHPGHFVFQPWQELHKLEVLMEEMILCYNTTEEQSLTIEKNKIYAAKVDNKWYRVLVKGVLTNGLVSIYELDHGRHELISYRNVQPLIEKFRQLPFQAVTAQLAGMKSEQWSEEAAVVFRHHVAKKPLVALIQTVCESTKPWDRKVVAYLVDTSLPDTDTWIHDLMSEYLVELSKAV